MLPRKIFRARCPMFVGHLQLSLALHSIGPSPHPGNESHNVPEGGQSAQCTTRTVVGHINDHGKALVALLWRKQGRTHKAGGAEAGRTGNTGRIIHFLHPSSSLLA